ncbi:MAG: sulfite exporter TauE/SafE family protein [Kiritimatiellia bacterium]
MNLGHPRKSFVLATILGTFCFLVSLQVLAAPALPSGPGSEHEWWIWTLALFLVALLIGVTGPLAGIGGGVLFVPVMISFFPFHMDFVRATALLVALSGALAASPRLLQTNLASFRLAMPLAAVSSIASVLGAVIGLALPDRTVQVALGAILLGVVILMLLTKNSENPRQSRSDRLAALLGIDGSYFEPCIGDEITWKVTRTSLGLALFFFVGLIAGMFGIGAGWASVPVINLVMGAPLKVAVATSTLLLYVTCTSAVWVYIHRGCIVPLIVVPAVVGVMIGSRLGVWVLQRARPVYIRRLVLALLAFSALKVLTQGLGLPFLF